LDTFKAEAYRILDRYLSVPSTWSSIFTQTKDYLMTCEDKRWDIFPDNENNMCNFIDFLMQREKKNMHTTNFYGEQCKTVGRNIMKQSSSALTNLCIILKEVSRDEVKQWRTNKVHSVLKTWNRSAS